MTTLHWNRFGTPGALLRLTFLGILIAYLPTVGFDFVYDDVPGIMLNPWLHSYSGLWLSISRHSSAFVEGAVLMPARHYRPMYLIWVWLVANVFGFAPGWFHLWAVFLHITATYLAFRLAKHLLGNDLSAAVTAVVFGLHPTKVETVSWIAAATESLMAVFFFAALLAYLRAREEKGKRGLWLGVLFLSSLAAFLTKETAAVLPVIICAYELLVAPTRAIKLPPQLILKLSAPVWAALASFLLVRFRVLHGVGDAAAAAPLRVNLFTAPTAFWLYARQLIWPVHLSELYPITVVEHFSMFRVLLPFLAAAFLAVLYWLWARHSPVLKFSAAWYVLTLTPVIAEFNWVQLHDRHLYLPSFAIALMASVAICQLRWPFKDQPGMAPAVAAAALAIVMTTVSAREARVWNTELTVFSRAVEVAPANTEAVDLLATAYRNSGLSDKAEATWRRGVENSPNSTRLNLALGTYYYEVHQYDQAAIYLRRAVKNNPHIPGALFELGMIEWQDNEYSCAERHLAQAVELKPQNGGYRHSLQQLRTLRTPAVGGEDGGENPTARDVSPADCASE